MKYPGLRVWYVAIALNPRPPTQVEIKTPKVAWKIGISKYEATKSQSFMPNKIRGSAADLYSVNHSRELSSTLWLEE